MQSVPDGEYYESVPLYRRLGSEEGYSAANILMFPKLGPGAGERMHIPGQTIVFKHHDSYWSVPLIPLIVSGRFLSSYIVTAMIVLDCETPPRKAWMTGQNSKSCPDLLYLARDVLEDRIGYTQFQTVPYCQ